MKRFSILALAAVSAAATAQVWDSGTGLGVAIPDVGSVTYQFNPVGIAAGPVVQFHILMNPLHTWRGDLRMTLTDPLGNALQIYNQQGGSGDFISAYFQDGGLPLSTSGNLNSAVSGLFYQASGGNLSTLSHTVGGTWTLFAEDLAGGDTGTIDQIRLATVPEPGTMIALGLGAAALVRRRRAAKK
jgi:subtilisin-like proprotein convertase family protein